MAAFMKRLGDALTPVRLPPTCGQARVDLERNVVVCQTAHLSVTGYPRTAYADAALSASAAADVNFAADVVMSTDGGANWTALNAANPTAGRRRPTSGAAFPTSARRISTSGRPCASGCGCRAGASWHGGPDRQPLPGAGADLQPHGAASPY